jgi:uncharacterized protein (DUF1684 family)
VVPLAACGPGEQTPEASTPAATEAAAAVEATSLLGEELVRPALPDAFRAEQETLLAEARQALEAAPDDPEALVWVGRRTAYLGRYREAIELFTEGIERHPDHAPLYRHRGHRHLTTRQLDAAIADLSRAAELVEGAPDEVEADGLPNERGIPTSTLQSNIFYHLGLAHYLEGDFESARRAWERCLEVSTTADNVVATAHWLYMTLRRLGLDAEAAALLEPISADLDIIENHEYHRLTLMYKGEIEPEALWREVLSSDDTLGSATLGYGVGNWLYYEGLGEGPETGRAYDLFAHLHSGEQWAAFGHLASEAELTRLESHEREVHAWRGGRLARLLRADGWLSLAGLFRLEPGEASFGTDPSADLVFTSDAPSPPEPRVFGTLTLSGPAGAEGVFVEPAPGVEILVGGAPVEGRIELEGDADGKATEMEVAPFRFWLIERSGRPLLRLIDLSRVARAEVPRIPSFPIDEDWVVRARFEPYVPARTIPVPTILDTIDPSPSPGALVFERDGAEHRLDAIESGDQLFLVFADATTGGETYGGGRYLYTGLPDPDGLVTVDFNRAYNPPCVFTAHATCPLPPQQNRLELVVDAGEKAVAGYLDH